MPLQSFYFELNYFFAVESAPVFAAVESVVVVEEELLLLQDANNIQAAAVNGSNLFIKIEFKKVIFEAAK